MATTSSAGDTTLVVPFAAEPGRAATQRRRFWFSGGARIDQGPTSAVVGVVWTHWLAARQIPPPAGDYDFAYALDLFHEAQRQAGQPEDDLAGAQLDDSVTVMFRRGLITACAACRTIDDVKAALLGYGPVIAGIEWRSAMFEPDRTYRQPICRVDVDSPVAGGHAVLLDGIDLDLELGGVTGFIRFKNSWGPAWGDGGSALISIDDVEKLIGRSGPDFLLPTPAGGPPDAPVDPDGVIFPTSTAPISAPPTTEPPKSPRKPTSSRSRSKLRSSPKKAAAKTAPSSPSTTSSEATPPTVEAPPEPSPSVAYEKQPIGSDRYTISDNIGYSSYANAIAQGIQHPDTHPPLSIGIKAPWGAGKTSLMRMVRHRLEWPDSWATTPQDAKPTKIELTGSTKPVTYWTLLRQVTGHHGESAEPEPNQLTATIEQQAQQQMSDNWRPTVWFNPWMYQTGEQIWAGFAQEIIRQITERLDPLDRERFWLSLNLSRVDEQAVRRKVYSLVVDRLLPWLLGAVLLICIGVIVYIAGATAWLAGLVAATGPALVAVNVVRTLSTSVSGSLRGILEPAGGAASMAKKGWHGTFDEVVHDPAYASRTGSFALTRNDIQEVINLVATDRRPLVIFIDDLDRCQPGAVLQVLEAINLFLADQLDRAIFVIAIEPDMVAAHIEVSYSALVANLDSVTGSRREGDTLGWSFLEKFIQLPLSLPPLEHTTTQRLVRTLFGTIEPPPADGESAKTRLGAEAEYDAAFRAARQIYATQQTLEGSAHIASAVDSDSASGQAANVVTVEKLSDDSPDMRGVIEYGTKHLRGNPREVTRYVNVFRFLVMIAGARKLQVKNELAVLAKLAVLSTRWPSLHSYLMTPLTAGSTRTVFDLLETPDSGSAKTDAGRATAELRTLTAGLTDCGFSERIVTRLLDDDLRRFMRTEPLVGALAAEWL